MLTSPYSIYINKRPLRIAFLIDDKPESLTRSTTSADCSDSTPPIP